MATKKYTRKQLKQPDEFISFSMRAWEMVKDHTKQVAIMAAVALLIIAVVWTWTYFAEAAGRKDTAALTRALDIYEQPVVELAGADLKEEEGGIPRFKDRGAKLKAATEEFAKLATGGSGALPDIALLMKAGVNYDRGQYAEAITDYQALLEQSKDERLTELATEGLGYAFEATKALDKALEQFRKLPKDGDKRFKALYQEARILALKGKKKEAVDLLKKIIKDGTGSSYAEHASSRLALLEAK